MQVGMVGVITSVKNAIQLCRLAQSNDIARITLQDICILVERFLPLLGLHVAETKTTSGYDILWELYEGLLIVLQSFRPVAVPAVTISRTHCSTKNLSVPRHVKIRFLKRYQLTFKNVRSKLG
jgi:hypothetical protein